MHRSGYAALWVVPFGLHSDSAWAWGLYTHLYFAQLLLWAVPLADPAFRRAIRRFPELLLAGACLPDTALFSRWVRSGALRATHQWSSARRMLEDARDDGERAIVAGYASHLLVDVIAHNHFVPAHEALWLDAPVVAHAASEWAMDHHIAPQLFARPADILSRHLHVLAPYAARTLGCTPGQATWGLRCLAHGERLLRASRLHRAAYHGARLGDRRSRRRFDYYIAETTARLPQINRLVAGDAPVWQPEIDRSIAGARPEPAVFRRQHGRTPLPQDLFS